MESNRLIGIRAKIERARQHIHDLEIQLVAFAQNNRQFNPVLIEDDPETGEIIHRVRFLVPIPDAVPLIAGDAAHNLRSALDHLAWQLVEANGGSPGRHTSYPICNTPEGYQKALKKGVVEGIDPGLLPLIQATQPYQSGYVAMRMLNELDNHDKHRLLIVAAARVADAFYGMNAAGIAEVDRRARASGGPIDVNWLANEAVFSNSNRAVIIKDGDILMRVPPMDGLEKYIEVYPAFKIVFREPAIIGGRAVQPVLTQFAEMVEGIVNQFASFL